VSAVAHGEERIGPEITPEEPNYNRDEGLALQLLCDCLHVPFPDMKDGKLVFVGGNTTEDEARRALCRILRDEKWGPSGYVLDALVAVFDPDARDAALQGGLKEAQSRSRQSVCRCGDSGCCVAFAVRRKTLRRRRSRGGRQVRKKRRTR
jgi:hypothetical protein